MISPMQFLQNAMRQNPNVANNPQAQNYLNILQSGDSQKGQQIAENLLKTYGMTKEQGLSQVRQFFHF